MRTSLCAFVLGVLAVGLTAQSATELNEPKPMLLESSATATAPDEERIAIDGTATVVRLWTENQRRRAAVSRDSGRTWISLSDRQTTLNFHFSTFDPINGEPAIPGMLQAGAKARLFIVQFHTQPLQEYRDGIVALGGEVSHYLAHQAYLVRIDPAAAKTLAAKDWVRYVGAYHPAYKFEPAIIDRYLKAEPIESTRFNIMMVNRATDEAALAAAVESIRGTIDMYARGNILIEATMDGMQLLDIAANDTVLWVDRWGQPESDMDLVRAQGGADYLEPKKPLRYTGKGLRGHIMEGIYRTHPEFAANAYRALPISVVDGTAAGHGNATCGIVFARGAQPTARGLCPDGQPLFTNYNYVINTNNRNALTKDLVDPSKTYKAMFQTASWGYPRTTIYTSRSAEMDTIIFDHNIPITQSQSNAGATPSRPQAWAKNIISVGGIRHYNTATLADDKWASSGSTGPANDGRIKPDMVAFYDSIYTTGYGANSYGQFGGTSGATPIVCGHVGLLTEMITDGIFGHATASSWSNRFPVKPNYSLTKALLINTARPYSLAPAVATRYQQGWGFPNVQDPWDRRFNILAPDELDVLTNRTSTTYFVWVPGTLGDLRTTLTWVDTENAPTTKSPHINNDLDLNVSGPSGTFWGNNGLVTNPHSTAGGSANKLDTVENVFVRNAQKGIYAVRVDAAAIVADTHRETRVTDADFALVVNGVGGGRDRSGMTLDLFSARPGDLRVQLQNLPSGYTEGWVVYSLDTSRPEAFGHYFGIEADLLTIATFFQPAAVGSPYHFQATGLNVFPNTTYGFNPAVAAALKGLELDAVALAVKSGVLETFSNVSRVKVQ